LERPSRSYLVDLSRATRSHPGIALGVSPRGMLIWQRVSQAWAFLQGRDFVTPDDIQAVAEAVLSVRLGVHKSGDGGEARRLVRQLITQVPAPF
jgi:MoxR-like ATPase